MPSLVNPKFVVLVILLDGPKYGMQLKEAVFTRSDGEMGHSNGFIYDLLAGLEADGFVAPHRPTASPRGGRALVAYSLTEAGRMEIQRCAHLVAKLLLPVVRVSEAG